MRLVCLSDTHGRHAELEVPAGDILVHAGDFTRHGNEAEVRSFNDWLASLPHPHKLVIAGNHDFLFEKEPAKAQALLTAAHYLEDSGRELLGLRFWGSPVSPRFFDWAFNRQRGPEIRGHWRQVPAGIDVLIVHTPPHGLRDRVWLGRHVGCEDLRDELLGRIRPQLVVCGHIHEAAGHERIDAIQVLNACSLDRGYKPTQPIWTVEFSKGRIGKIEKAGPNPAP